MWGHWQRQNRSLDRVLLCQQVQRTCAIKVNCQNISPFTNTEVVVLSLVVGINHDVSSTSHVFQSLSHSNYPSFSIRQEKADSGNWGLFKIMNRYSYEMRAWSCATLTLDGWHAARNLISVRAPLLFKPVHAVRCGIFATPSHTTGMWANLPHSNAPLFTKNVKNVKDRRKSPNWQLINDKIFKFLIFILKILEIICRTVNYCKFWRGKYAPAAPLFGAHHPSKTLTGHIAL